jgi:hypothetical protein
MNSKGAVLCLEGRKPDQCRNKLSAGKLLVFPSTLLPTLETLAVLGATWQQQVQGAAGGCALHRARRITTMNITCTDAALPGLSVTGLCNRQPHLVGVHSFCEWQATDRFISWRCAVH